MKECVEKGVRPCLGYRLRQSVYKYVLSRPLLPRAACVKLRFREMAKRSHRSEAE